MNYLDQTGLLPGGNRYRGNLHSHTTVSDGNWTPEEAAREYRAHGYSFLVLTDHDIYTDRTDLDTDDFILLPGVEASATLRAGRRMAKTHHLLGIGIPGAANPFRDGERLSPPRFEGGWDGAAAAQALCDTLRARGCLVVYNHPIWSRVEEGEVIHTRGLTALEVWNYATVSESGLGWDDARWDVMLRAGNDLFAVATDDNHNGGTYDESFGGWITVRAAALTREAITAAILAGSYYSSAGPEIEAWGVRDNRVWVECSLCERINMLAGGPIGNGRTALAPGGGALRGASFPLRGGEEYVRVECVDHRGRKAWSNPLRLRPAPDGE